MAELSMPDKKPAMRAFSFVKRDFMEWVIGGFVVLVILGAIFKPSSCDVCGTGFKKKYYT
jgi:hypothetical protein